MKNPTRSLLTTFGLLVLVTLIAAYMVGCGKKDDKKSSKKKKNRDSWYYGDRNFNQGNHIDGATGYAGGGHVLQLDFFSTQNVDSRYDNRNYDPRYQQPQQQRSFNGPVLAQGTITFTESINPSYSTGAGSGWGFSAWGSVGGSWGNNHGNYDPRYSGNRHGDPRYQGPYHGDPCRIPTTDRNGRSLVYQVADATVRGGQPGVWQNSGFGQMELIARGGGVEISMVTTNSYGNPQYDFGENYIGGYYAGTKYLYATLRIQRIDSGNRCQSRTVVFGL